MKYFIPCQLCGRKITGHTIKINYCDDCNELMNNWHSYKRYRTKYNRRPISFIDYCKYLLQNNKKTEKAKRILRKQRIL